MMRQFANLILCLGAWTTAHAVTDPVAEINAQVARAEEALRGDSAINIVVKADGPIEGSPPEIRFSTLSGRLVSAQLSVGHETWRSRVTIFFYEDGKPMKYLRTVTGRQVGTERQAIIYAPDGKVVWSNVEAPMIDVAEVQSVFRAIEALRRSSARY